MLALQVAAFGPAAARSLLFLGHLQSLSVSTWPAECSTAAKFWSASVTTSHSAAGRLRVGECSAWMASGVVADVFAELLPCLQ
jgi:hypothetical protein